MRIIGHNHRDEAEEIFKNACHVRVQTFRNGGLESKDLAETGDGLLLKWLNDPGSYLIDLGDGEYELELNRNDWIAFDSYPTELEE